jgi:hypothetical protein
MLTDIGRNLTNIIKVLKPDLKIHSRGWHLSDLTINLSASDGTGIFPVPKYFGAS